MKSPLPFLACFAVGLVLACGEGPTVPQDAVDIQESSAPQDIPGALLAKAGSGGMNRESFAFTVRGCDGNEDVRVRGYYRIRSKVTESRSGNLKISVKSNARGKGVGVRTGADYVWSDSFTDYFLHFGVNHFNGHSRKHTRLIGKGEAPNVRFDLFRTFYLDREGAVQIRSTRARGCGNLQMSY